MGEDAAGFDASGLALETPVHGGLAPCETLRLSGRAEAGQDPIVAVRIRLNGELAGAAPVAAGRFEAALDIETEGSRLDLRLTGLRRSGATAEVKLLTVWRPVLAPRRERIAPLVVEYRVAGGHLSGHVAGPDRPVAIDVWRGGRVTHVAVEDDGAFSAHLAGRGHGRAHLWARFRYDRPDAYVGDASVEPLQASTVALETTGGAVMVRLGGESPAPMVRAKLRAALAERLAARRRLAFVNGRPATLTRLRGAPARFALTPAGWAGALPDRIEVELFSRDGAPLGAGESWDFSGLPIRAFMASSAAGRALSARRGAARTIIRARRVNASGDDMVFIAEGEGGAGFSAVPLSELAEVAIAEDVPFASDPAETPPPDLAAFIKSLPGPGYRLKAAERATGTVVLPCAAPKPPPSAIRRVLLLRPGPNATDELYVLRPLAPLLAKLGLALEIADSSGGPRPDEPLGEGTAVIVSRSVNDAWLARLAQDRRSIFIIYLMDDDPPAAADSPGVPQRYRARMIEACRSDFQAMLRLCDRFVVASPGLAARYASPKTVLLEPPFIREPESLSHFDDLSRLRLAYHGTDVHRDDIAFLYEPIARCLAAFPNAHFQVISTIKPPKSFKTLSNFERIAPMGWTDYVAFARRTPVHLNLAPMLDTPFNRAKSVIKVLDTASLGAAGLYSRVPPYENAVRNGVDGLLVGNDPAEWEAALSRLIADPSRLKGIAQSGLMTARRIGALDRATAVWRRILGLD